MKKSVKTITEKNKVKIDHRTVRTKEAQEYWFTEYLKAQLLA
jgi:hypothetical protein